jgi:hypothetical protein
MLDIISSFLWIIEVVGEGVGWTVRVTMSHRTSEKYFSGSPKWWEREASCTVRLTVMVAVGEVVLLHTKVVERLNFLFRCGRM